MAYLRLLGGASLEGPRGPLTGPAVQRHRLALLALLVMASPGGMSRDKLLAYLWPEKDQRRAGNLLRQAVHHVRKAVGHEAIESSAGVLVLRHRILPSDVHAFREHADAGRWSEAMRLYGGPFLDGFHLSGTCEFDRWMTLERRSLADRYRRGLEHLARSEEAAARWTEAVRWWNRRVAAEPTNSRAVEHLMRALAHSGNPAGALTALARHETVLVDELGVSPPGELLALKEELNRATAEETPEPPDARAGTRTSLGPKSRPLRSFAVAGVLLMILASAVAWAVIGGAGAGAGDRFAGAMDPDPAALVTNPDRESLRELSPHDHLLKGNEYMARPFSEGALRAAIDQYRRAVELDPSMAEAWRRLIHYGVWLAGAFGDVEAGHRATQDMAALTALGLEGPEARLARAAYLHYGERAYEEAYVEARALARERPNDAEVLILKGASQMRRGDLEGAAHSWAGAMDLDPREPGLALSLGHAFRYLGRYHEAERYYHRAVALAPDAGYTHAALEPVYLAQGEPQKARDLRERAWERGVHAWLGGRAEVYDRDYQKAVRRLEAHPQSGSNRTRAYRLDVLADAYGRLGDTERRDLYADSLLNVALEMAPEAWDRPRESWANLGWVFAGLALLHMGQSEEALEHVRRGLAKEAPFADAFVGARMERIAARALVRMGYLDEALDLLEAVRTVPVTLSAYDLRNDPEWDPLRDHPRFRRLVRAD